MTEPRRSFADWCRRTRVSRIIAFGDSITVGMGASTPRHAWVSLLERETGVPVTNRGLSGTVLQNSPDASGRPRANNGMSRFERDLLFEPAEALCILYGYNDARYVAAPSTFSADAFGKDYRAMIGRLLAGGYKSRSIVLGSPPYPCDTGFGIGSDGFTGQTRAGFEAYVAAVRDVAIAYGLAYAPVYERMSVHPDGSLASADITHPGDAGHRVIADAFLEAASLERASGT